VTRGRSTRGNPGDRQQWPPPACRYPELPRLRRHRLSAAWRTGRFRVWVMTDQDGLPAAQDRCAGGHRLTHLGPAMSGPVRFARGGPAPGLHDTARGLSAWGPLTPGSPGRVISSHSAGRRSSGRPGRDEPPDLPGCSGSRIRSPCGADTSSPATVNARRCRHARARPHRAGTGSGRDPQPQAQMS
jgi:hypothetical protein